MLRYSEGSRYPTGDRDPSEYLRMTRTRRDEVVPYESGHDSNVDGAAREADDGGWAAEACGDRDAPPDGSLDGVRADRHAAGDRACRAHVGRDHAVPVHQ